MPPAAPSVWPMALLVAVMSSFVEQCSPKIVLKACELGRIAFRRGRRVGTDEVHVLGPHAGLGQCHAGRRGRRPRRPAPAA